MRYGHTPAEIDAMPLRDIELFQAALPVIWAHEHPLAEID